MPETCNSLFWALVAYFFLTVALGLVWVAIKASRGMLRQRKEVPRPAPRSAKSHHRDVPEEVESWQIDMNDLRFVKPIGQGSVGEVFEGNYRGNKVAIKRLQGVWTHNDEMVERFRDEIFLMSTINHPNVLIFIGAAQDEHRALYLVTELCRSGTLHDYLHDPKTPLAWADRIRIANDVARGMHYLHGRAGIIQRDLKTENLLLDEFFRVKIADFGFSRRMTSKGRDTLCGTPATMAPEIFMRQKYDEKADVYSFGIILWEILTREDPYLNPGLEVAREAAEHDLRPPVPVYCPREYAWVMTKAWSGDPGKRPSFDFILLVLRVLQSTVDDSIRGSGSKRTGTVGTATGAGAAGLGAAGAAKGDDDTSHRVQLEARVRAQIAEDWGEPHDGAQSASDEDDAICELDRGLGGEVAPATATATPSMMSSHLGPV